MDASLKTCLWQQFGAAIDMLENALTTCPDELWNTDTKFWYIGYHTIFWLDYYLSVETPMEKDFAPPAPFTLSEFGYDLPERVYDKEELLTYLLFGRQKCHDLIASLTAEELFTKRFISEYKNFILFELLLYNMRHVQHHTAQLNMLLRQSKMVPPDWVSRTAMSL